jgi:hypothetical protein
MLMFPRLSLREKVDHSVSHNLPPTLGRIGRDAEGSTHAAYRWMKSARFARIPAIQAGCRRYLGTILPADTGSPRPNQSSGRANGPGCSWRSRTRGPHRSVMGGISPQASGGICPSVFKSERCPREGPAIRSPRRRKGVDPDANGLRIEPPDLRVLATATRLTRFATRSPAAGSATRRTPPVAWRMLLRRSG